MFRNYLTITLRFLKRNKLFAAINILGLSLALAASFIILLFVINELSYNSYFSNRKHIYRVISSNTEHGVSYDGTPYVLSQRLKNEFPQVSHIAPTFNIGEIGVKINHNYVPIRDVISTSSELFNVFNLNINGSHNSLLDEPNSIVISQKQAQRFFSQENPIGKELEVKLGEVETVMVVTGVFADIPVNSTLQAECFINPKLVLAELTERMEGEDSETSWNSDFWCTWLTLEQNTNISLLDEQFRRMESSVYGENNGHNFSLQSLDDVYLESQDIGSSFKKGSAKNIRIFSAIAMLIIVVATFNYIILSTAVSTGRAKEIGIRKTSGASVRSIRRQLFSESVILSVLVLPIALLLAWIGKPYAEELFQTRLDIIDSNIAIYVVVYIVLTVLIGVVSGLYSSSFLSRLNVISILTNSLNTGKQKLMLRSALIVAQLVIFCFFVSSTLIIRSQYNYALNKDMGYFSKDVLFVDMGDYAFESRAFISGIKSYPDIVSVGGATTALPMVDNWPYSIEHPMDKSKQVPIELLAVNYEFVDAMGIQVIEGRSFSRESDSEAGPLYLLNEKAVKELGLSNPIGARIDVENGEVIGVVKDFNLHSFRSDIPPLMIVASDAFVMQVAVHYQPGTLKRVLPLIKAEWEKVAQGQPFIFKTIDEFKEEIYTEEKNLSVILSIVALFSLLIASFGLFGLTLFLVKSQTKEIGVKKVFGSSESLIVLSFLRKNFLLVVIATILSVPITLWVMEQWLSKFYFKTSIEWWVFAITFLLAAAVVLVTVLFHSYRASQINPVEALRYE